MKSQRNRYMVGICWTVEKRAKRMPDTFVEATKYLTYLAIIFLSQKIKTQRTSTKTEREGSSVPNIFSEKIGDVDGGEVPCQAWTTRMPKYVQPDLNFTGNFYIFNAFLFQ